MRVENVSQFVRPSIWVVLNISFHREFLYYRTSRGRPHRSLSYLSIYLPTYLPSLVAFGSWELCGEVQKYLNIFEFLHARQNLAVALSNTAFALVCDMLHYVVGSLALLTGFRPPDSLRKYSSSSRSAIFQRSLLTLDKIDIFRERRCSQAVAMHC